MAKLREKEAKKQKRRELLGDDYVSQDEDEADEESEGCEDVEGEEGAEGQPPTKEEKVKEPGTILSSFYNHGDENNFWVSMVSVELSIIITCLSRMGIGNDVCTVKLKLKPVYSGHIAQTNSGCNKEVAYLHAM